MCPPEIELDIELEREIELDLLAKDEKEKNNMVDFYNNNIGMITSFIFQDMNFYLEKRNGRKANN